MGYNILILEDNKVDAQFEKDCLDRSGEPFDKISMVFNKEDYVEFLQNSSPDLILADYRLVDFNGLDAIRLKKKYCEEVPLIIVSGTIGEEKAVEVIKEGAADFLIKNNIEKRLAQVSIRAIREAEEKNRLKEMEGLLKKSKENYRLLTENSTDMISRQTPGGEYLYVSPASSDLMGYKPEELVGNSVFDYIHPDDLEITKNYRQEVMNKKNTHIVSYRAKHKNGAWKWVESTQKKIRDPETDEVFEIQAATRDISERKIYEQELEQESKFNKTILKSLPGIFFMLDKDGCIRSSNSRLQNILEYIPNKSNKKKPFVEFISNTDRDTFLAGFTEAFKSGFMELEVSLKTKKDKKIPYLIKGIVDTLNGNKRLLCTGIDITDRVRTEEMIQKSLKEKEILLMEIHHRVKNNLALISGIMQLHASESNNSTVIDHLTNSQSRIKSIAIVHELLYETHNFSEIPLNRDLEKLIEHISSTVQAKTNVNWDLNLENVEINVNQAIPCALIVNEVITNVFKHAFKGRKGGNVKVSLKEKDKMITIKISDDGVGMANDVSINNSGNLGMTLIKTLSKQLEGHFEYKTDDQGTVFELVFAKQEMKGGASHFFKETHEE